LTQVKLNISKIVKDLVSGYQGQILAYDEGLFYGDAILAAAIWRNLYHANNTVKASELAIVVDYVRRNLKAVQDMALDDVLESKFKFC
jgi:cytochrome b pre-mRNA-processing protein 3